MKLLRFVTFNILSDHLTYFNHGLCKRADDPEDDMIRYNVVFKILSNPANDMDVIFLQEVGKLFHKYFLHKLTRYHIISNKSGNLVILLNKNFFISDYTKEEWINSFSDNNNNFDFARNKLLIISAFTFAKQRFLLINVHLPVDKKTKDVIVDSINDNLNKLSKLSKKDIYVICAGDFNIPKDIDVNIIRKLTSLFDDEKTIDYTSFKMGICENDKSKNEDRKFTYLNKPHKFLDRIYVSDNFALRTINYPLKPIHNYVITQNDKYLLTKSNDSFSNHGYPFTLIHKKNDGSFVYETKKYADILKNDNKYQWPSDHAMLSCDLYFEENIVNEHMTEYISKKHQRGFIAGCVDWFLLIITIVIILLIMREYL